MIDLWLDVVPLVATVALAAWLVFPTPARLAKRRQQFTLTRGAYVDPVFVATFDRDTRRMQRWAAFLALVLVGGAVAWGHLTRLSLELLAIPFFWVGLGFVAVVRLRSAGREFAVPESRSAVARPRQVVLSDYVSGWAQLLAWLAVLLTGAVGAGVLTLWRQDEAGATVTVIALVDSTLVLAMAIFTHWFGHAMCRRPTPAVDASHLYLQDAWRAASLSLAYGTVCVSAFLLAGGLFGSAVGPRWFEHALQLTSYVSMAAWFLFMAVQHRHFRRRLWATLLPGEVLLPGQPVPRRVGAIA